MQGYWDVPKDQAIKAYGEVAKPSLTDQLLYAILAQLDKINEQLDRSPGDETS